MGRRAYRLSSGGVAVFPRLADPAREGGLDVDGGERISSGSQVKRALTALKARASALEPTVREFEIRADGIVLGDELAYGHDVG